MKHEFKVDQNTEVEKFTFSDSDNEDSKDVEKDVESKLSVQQSGETCVGSVGTANETDTKNPTTKSNITPFHNADLYQPTHELQQERPYHRLILLLLAKGLSAQEIQEETGWTVATIHNLRKQPWAQKYIAQTMETLGRRVVEDKLRGAAAKAAEVLVDVMEGTIAAKVEQRIKAANDILERAFPSSQQSPNDGRTSEELTDAEIIQRLKDKIA